MFTYQISVTQGFPLPCTEDIWNEIIDRPAVKNLCDKIAALDPAAPDYNDRKQALKRRLPIIIPHARAFVNNKRVSADAVPSGLAMLDVDHVAKPREWFGGLIAGTTAKNLESGIQSRETAKKDSDEEAARRDSAEDLTGGGRKLHYGIIA